MQNTYQSYENPEDGKKFYLAIDDENNPQSINLEKFIEENYENIYKSMKDENKTLNTDDTFFLYKEILYEGEIIGYVSYDLLNEFSENTIIILNHYYILEDYLDYTLLIDDMIETGFSLGFQIIIKYPTRDLVEALIECEFAYRIDNKIVFSEIAFMSDTISIDTSINKVMDEIDIKGNSHSYTISSLYDLDLCGIITLTPHPEKIYKNQELNDNNIDDYCSLSISLREDEEKYNCIKKRRKNKLLSKGKYFVNVNDILTKYEEKQK